MANQNFSENDAEGDGLRGKTLLLVKRFFSGRGEEFLQNFAKALDFSSKDATIVMYLLATIAAKILLSFLIMPLVLKKMAMEDYGKASFVANFVMVAMPVLCLNYTATLPLSAKDYGRDALRQTNTMLLLSAGLFLLLLSALAGPLTEYFGVGMGVLALLGLTCCLSYYNSGIVCYYKFINNFSAALVHEHVSSIAGGAGYLVVLLVLNKLTIMSYSATNFFSMLFFLAATASVYKRVPALSWMRREKIFLSLKLIPNIFGSTIIAFVPMFALSSYYGKNEVAVYSVVLSIAGLGAVFSNVYVSLHMKELFSFKPGDVWDRIIFKYVFCMIAGAISLGAAAYLYTILLLPPSYATVWKFVPPVFFSSMLMGIDSFFNVPCAVNNITRYSVIGSMTHVCAQIFFCFVAGKYLGHIEFLYLFVLLANAVNFLVLGLISRRKYSAVRNFKTLSLFVFGGLGLVSLFLLF